MMTLDNPRRDRAALRVEVQLAPAGWEARTTMVQVLVGSEANGLIAGNPPLVVIDGVTSVATRIAERKRLCEQRTSYFGDVLDHWQTFRTPWGVWERHYWARGGGLERSGVDWRCVSPEEIAAKAAEARRLAEAAQKAADDLRALTPA